jgi:2-dehydro-3-deoxyphosphogluconate aldolase/(4S)-4-hydroxy-2-oxoglutarate aldolase
VSDPLQPLRDARVLAVLRVEDAGHTGPAVAALVAGGMRAVELTFSSPGAAEELAAARRAHGTEVLFGAGTLRSVREVQAAVEAGADFLVSPHLSPRLLEAMLASGLPALPGVFTASEVAAALDGGARAVKLFPASIGGIGHLTALRGPFPDLLAVPTGGIREENVAAWLAAGALAVGVGGELCRRDLIERRRFDELAGLAERFSRAARPAA